MMNKDEFTIEEQTVINRLRRAPQADLSTEAFEKIQNRLWDELDGLSTPSSAQAIRGLSFTWIILALLAILIAIIIGLFVFQSLSGNENDLPAVIETIATNTTVPSEETEIIEDTASITETIIENTQEANTVFATVQATPIVESSEEAHIIIEGQIQALGINSIQIFDTEIQIDPADPILMEIRIGDTIRVEGNISFENNLIVIVAVNITVINSTIIEAQNPTANQANGGGLPANCRIKKSGKITCKNSRR